MIYTWHRISWDDLLDTEECRVCVASYFINEIYLRMSGAEKTAISLFAFHIVNILTL